MVAVALVAVLGVAISRLLLIQQRQTGGILPQSFQASDFLRQWYNSGSNATNPLVSFYIGQNQGTYTIDVVQNNLYEDGYHSDDWGTTVLTINPPSAHAFYTFQRGGSVDLQLRLFNATSMQVIESFQYGTLTSIQTEQFAKLPTTFEGIGLDSYDWTQAESLTLLLTNTGNLPVTFSQFNFVSYLGSWFNGTKAPPERVLAGNCPIRSSQLKPGSTCSVTITTQGRLQVECIPTNGSVMPAGGCGVEIWSTDGTFLGVFICVPGQRSASSGSFDILLQPQGLLVIQGQVESFVVTVQVQSVNGFNGVVTLTEADNLCSGASNSFDTTTFSVASGNVGFANWIFNFPSNCPAGTYQATVTGGSGLLVVRATLVVVVGSGCTSNGAIVQ